MGKEWLLVAIASTFKTTKLFTFSDHNRLPLDVQLV